MRINNIKTVLYGILIIGIANTSCTKPDRDDDFTPGDPPPVPGGYLNSAEVAPDNLVTHFAFDGNIEDQEGGITGGTSNGTTSFVEGVKGQAYKGSQNGFISYNNPGPIITLKSFTVSMWINTEKHIGGAQGVFALTKQDGSFWGNFFMIIEGNDNPSDNRMFMKLHFENNTPSIDNKEHWIEPGGNFRPDNMYGGWRHVAWTYDATTSKAGFFINGERRALPTGAEDRTANSSGAPLGELNFKDATQFVIGGFQNQLGSPYNNPEPWMLTYTGALDEFRIYDKALSAQEISALAVLERQGR